MSSEFDAYCDDAIASNVCHVVPRWVPAVSAAGAVAALLVLSLILPRTPVDSPAFHAPHVAVTASPALVAKGLPAAASPIHRVHRQQGITPVQIENSIAEPLHNQYDDSLGDESVIQIAIPADEMFPPGAVPEGMQFAADLTIAADGSAKRLRLQPRLSGFERRTTQQ